MRLVVVAVAITLAVLLLPHGRAALRTAVLVPELLDLPVRPLSAATPAPVRETSTYADPPLRLDLHLPAGARPDGSRPAIVLVLGVHPQPLDHPDVLRIAGSMARLGVVVGVPDSPALRATRVEPEEPARLAAAVRAVAERPEVDPSRVGLAGFSAGASLALVAAAHPSVVSELSFVSAFGGYADAATLLVDVASRTVREDGSVHPWPAEPGVRGDVLALLLDALDEAAEERERLRALLEPVIAADAPPSGPDRDAATSLDGDALAAYRLFTAASRTEAEAALAAASRPLHARLAAISPTTVSADVRAPVWLMHGIGDVAIPVTHSLVIADALPAGTVRRVTLFGRFEHGQPGVGGLGWEDVPDVWSLGVHLTDLVAFATG